MRHEYPIHQQSEKPFLVFNCAKCCWDAKGSGSVLSQSNSTGLQAHLLGTELNVSLLSTAVDCGTLATPANGQVHYSGRTTFGHTATYSCHTGYNLRGGSTRTCQATRLWSGREPTCSRMLLLWFNFSVSGDGICT